MRSRGAGHGALSGSARRLWPSPLLSLLHLALLPRPPRRRPHAPTLASPAPGAPDSRHAPLAVPCVRGSKGRRPSGPPPSRTAHGLGPAPRPLSAFLRLRTPERLDPSCQARPAGFCGPLAPSVPLSPRDSGPCALHSPAGSRSPHDRCPPTPSLHPLAPSGCGRRHAASSGRHAGAWGPWTSATAAHTLPWTCLQTVLPPRCNVLWPQPLPLADPLGPCPRPSPACHPVPGFTPAHRLTHPSHHSHTCTLTSPSTACTFQMSTTVAVHFPCSTPGSQDVVQPCGISAAALCCVPRLSTSREPHSFAKPVLCSSSQEHLFSKENLFIDIRGQATDRMPDPGPPESLPTLPRPHLLPFPSQALCYLYSFSRFSSLFCSTSPFRTA